MGRLISSRCFGRLGDNLQKGEALKCFGTRFAVSEDKTVKHSNNQREREREREREK
jgi:hypothetical protein